ncbi:phasin family protein [Methylobacterium sp. PvR107]|uniref:phasin family protein n=1 Tax=Methylobacterium sp. PvR107 TaxID=2806597 RepID=UPI001AE57545|nr:phasin family protein [Methylobacterium sp. PvR107]MBP1179912.1 hypothetical protein [Methylobacterium sp. PvR107]
MDSETVTQFPTAPPAEALKTGIGIWRAFAVDLPLRVAAETMRFTSRRFQARADHLAALAACASLKDAFELQTAFVTKSMAEYQAEAATLSHEVSEAAALKAA